MPAPYTELLKRECEDDFLNHGLTHKQISKKRGVSTTFISKLSVKRNWMAKKEMQQKSIGGAIQSAQQTLGFLNQELAALVKQIQDEPDAEKKSQLRKDYRRVLEDMKSIALSLKRIEGDDDRLGNVITAIKSFREYVEPRCKEPGWYETFVEFLEGWVVWLQKN